MTPDSAMHSNAKAAKLQGKRRRGAAGSRKELSMSEIETARPSTEGPSIEGKVLQVERHDYTDLAPANRPRAHSMRGFDPIYTDIVDYIVRCTHRIWEERNVGLIYSHYTHNCVLYGTFGTLYSREDVVHDTILRVVEMPDRRGMATQVIWRGNDVDGFYTSHLVTGVGRNMEPGWFGPPTYRKFASRTVADCMILENKIYREWVCRDNMTLALQFGVDTHAFALKHARVKLQQGSTPQDLGENMRLFGQGQPEEADLSLAHTDTEAWVLGWMHDVWNKRMYGAIRDVYASNVQYHGVRMTELVGVHAVMNQTLRLAGLLPDAKLIPQHICSNPTDEGGERVAVRWVMEGHHLGPGALGDPTGQRVLVMGFTHLHIVDGKVRDEWVIYDELAMLMQVKLGQLMAKEIT